LTIDGISKINVSITNDHNSIAISLFNGTAGADFGLVGAIYYAKMTIDGVLARDFVPVPQGSTQFGDPAPSNCMWDKVTKAYFEKIGAGGFGILEVIE
jgi:hypothetical protein